MSTENASKQSSTTLWLTTFFLVAILPLWTITKVPFIMAYDPEGEWAKAHGFPATINFVFWLTGNGGFQAVKMKSPAANFFLVHVFFGITSLTMIAATLVNGSLRKRWGYVTLIMGALLGAHSLPASDRSKFWPIFVPDCFVMCTTCIWGCYIIYNYPKKDLAKQKKAEEKLEQLHYAQAFGAWGAGFAELGTNIIPACIHLWKTGVWKPWPDEPNNETGTTVYDWLSEDVGYTLFLWLCLIFWIVTPMYLLKKYKENPSAPHHVAPKVDTPFGAILKNGVVNDFFVPYAAFGVAYYIFKVFILKTNLFLTGPAAGEIFGPDMGEL
eukprot:CAMPEP_0195284310 /NCGR_PEP_ID=MMETSP0707-20130614/2554_1 /TAXON_ID=33640 /ORGANISM="Asterionellopsis glacialis, Strain CCMP134" /LENGTH=325 /DNA_ID=CAMNT_0040343635 /DNA_START=57 /DNA_END=1034 /DNA_ORIENTATION=+